MPSGRTHDRITLWLLPVVTLVTYGLTRSGDKTLIVAGSFLFTGLMFGPDLDIHSRQFIRWGWFRALWIPYQKALNHRSVFSHGLIIGTIIRVLYITNLVLVLTLLFLVVTQLLLGWQWNWQRLAEDGVRSLFKHSAEFIALFVGMELGSMSHSFSDWGGSAYKRYQKGGFQAVLPKAKKRQATSKRKSPGRKVGKRTAKTQRTPRKKL